MAILLRDDDWAAAGDELAAAALAYAAAGRPVLPLHGIRAGACTCGREDCTSPGKHPRTLQGLKDATTDTELVDSWWARWPGSNVGIRTGAASGLVVLDIDVATGGAGTLARLEHERGKLPRTAEVLTGSGGKHLLFRHPGSATPNSAGKLGNGVDLRGDGGYVVAPPSLHASGRPYKWTRALERGLADPPAWLLAETVPRRNGAAPPVDDIIPEGRRRDTMLSVAGSLRRRGLTSGEIRATLMALNERCRPPLELAEVEALALDVATRYPAAPESAIPAVAPAAGRALADVLAAFEKWLWLPDPGVVYATLGTVAANQLDGDPVWTVLVGPPGSGKSEALISTSRLPDVHATATLTEPALLSGSSRRERAATAKGGLLRAIGDYGLILCKDLGSVFSMHREQRAAVLAALREVYDGSWTRHVGSDGGQTLSWTGKVGLLAGSTPTIDRHHAVMGTMGERFILFRMPKVEGERQARRALRHAGSSREMRAELAETVAGLFDAGLPRQPRAADAAESERLVRLATLVVSCRSAVERDGYSRDVELIPDAEAPARLVIVLERLLAGLDAIGAERQTAWRIVTKAALDSIPALRRAVIETLTSGEASTTEVAEAVRYPTQTTRRALEDLTAHEIIERAPGGQGKPDHWSLSTWARDRYVALSVPEKSETSALSSSSTVEEDFSGKVSS